MNENDIMNQIGERNRIMSSTRTCRHDDPAKVTLEESRTVIEQVRRHMDSTQLSNIYVARALGMSPSTISQVLNHKYAGDSKSIILDLDRWLDDEVKRASSPKPAEFVLTSVAREIQAVADLASQMNGIGMVYGQAGIGKTLALRAVAADKPGSTFVSLETVSATPQAVIEAIGRAMRVSPGNRYASARHWFEAIKLALRGSGRLLIIDQIHKLCGVDVKDRALYTLTDLHDATNAPQLWCGTEDMVEYLERGEVKGRESLAQIRSRIGICRDLHARTVNGDGSGQALFTIADIRKVFAQGKLKLTRDGERYLLDLANAYGSGGLRTCVRAVLIATMVKKGEGDLSAADLAATHEMLATRRALQRTKARMEEDRFADQLLVKAG